MNQEQKDTSPMGNTTIGFIQGQYVLLRPVLEPDLVHLAYLMGECPLGVDEKQLPWTEARLKKQFEDKEKPGLWDRQHMVYSVIRSTGEVVGFIDESVEDNGVRWIVMHVGESLPDRGEVGLDTLQAYLALTRKWGNVPRITSYLLACEEQKRRWFDQTGFELEITTEGAALYRGEICNIVIYGWLAPWVEANRAPEGIGR